VVLVLNQTKRLVFKKKRRSRCITEIRFETGLFRLSLVLNRTLVLCSVLTLVLAKASGLKPYLKPDLIVTLNLALIRF